MEFRISELKKDSRNKLRKGYWKTFLVAGVCYAFSSITITYIINNSIQEIPSLVKNLMKLGEMPNQLEPKIALVLITLFSTVSLLLFIARTGINIFLSNPLKVGAMRYYKKTLGEDTIGKISDFNYVFDGNYINVIKLMFFYHLLLAVGTLFFILPGIYLSYKYQMVPYIIDENNDITFKEALNKSSEIMKGNYAKAILLDLSFIPLSILSAITFGLAQVFYVEPYKRLTDTAFFLKLTNEEVTE